MKRAEIESHRPDNIVSSYDQFAMEDALPKSNILPLSAQKEKGSALRKINMMDREASYNIQDIDYDAEVDDKIVITSDDENQEEPAV